MNMPQETTLLHPWGRQIHGAVPTGEEGRELQTIQNTPQLEYSSSETPDSSTMT